MVAQEVYNEPQDDKRILDYIRATEELKRGNYDIQVPFNRSDSLGRLGRSLQELADTLEVRYQELNRLSQITHHINSGLLLEDVLYHIYDDFRDFIPYDRIGLAMIHGDKVISKWARSDNPTVKLGKDYEAPLMGSSLQTILDTRQPRIINDLQKYLMHKPTSESTRRIVAEGLRSSLTCPLIANSVPVGFIFFSSVEPNMYAKTHIDTFLNITNQLAVIVEKSWMMSEIVRQKAELEQQNEKLHSLQDLKNTFIAVAAHDLRNPIASILIGVELLSTSDESIFSPEDYTVIEQIQAQAKYMRALLDDLLSVTEIESGRFHIQHDEIDVNSFLEEAVRRHRVLAATKHITISLAPVPPGVVYADTLRMRQVIDNLISNAIKYSPIESSVTLRGDFDSEGWRIEVRDTGPGIVEEEQAALFQEFSRLSTRPTNGESSTGLGLAITRRIVEAHDGKIGVVSKVGEGSTFWFTLPHKVTR